MGSSVPSASQERLWGVLVASWSEFEALEGSWGLFGQSWGLLGRSSGGMLAQLDF